MSILAQFPWLEVFWPRMRTDEPVDPLLWRERFSMVMLAYAAVILPLTMLYSAPAFIAERRYGLIAIDTACWLYVLSQLFGLRTPFGLRRHLAIVVLYAVPVAFIVSIGPFGTRPSWLVICTVFAGVLFGVRGAIVSTLFNAVMLWAFYGLMGPGNKVWAPVYTEPMANWIFFATNTPLLGLAGGLAVSYLLDQLERSIRDQLDAAERLQIRSKELEKAHMLLQGEVEQRRTAEEELIRSEARYRLLAENAMDVIWTMDMELKVTYVTPSVYRSRGYTQQEIMAMKLTDHLTPDSFALVNRVLAEELAIEAREDRDLTRNRTLELEFNRKDGSTSWSEVNLGFIRDPGGKAVGILGVGRDITDRKQAEEELRASEERFRQLSAAAFEGIAISEGGVVLDGNPQLAGMLGGDLAEMIGRPVADFIAPESQELVRDHNRGGYEGYYEHFMRRKDGSTFPVEAHGRAMPWKDRMVRVTALRDISDQKRAEEEMRESEAAARKLAMENETMAAIGRIISSTLNIEEIYERFAEEVGKLLSFENLTINIIEPKGNGVKITYGSGAPIPEREVGAVVPLPGTMTEQIIRTRSGFIIGSLEEKAESTPGLRPVSKAGLQAMIAVPLISKDEIIGSLSFSSKRAKAYGAKDLALAERVGSQIAGAIANAQLYQQEKRIERELLKSEERFRLLVEMSPFLIWLHHEEKYIYLNPATVKAFGASKPEELIGRSIFEVIHPDYWDIAKGRIRALMKGEASPRVEEKLIRLDKQVIDVELADTQIPYQDKSIVLVVARDITDQKKAEREKEFLQEKLQQAQKMEAIGTLAGGIAHDFNNILSSILGYAELAGLDIPEGSKARYNLEQSMKSGYRARDLVQQILAFGRQGKQERKFLDIRPIVKESLKFLRASLPSTIAIQQEVEEDLGMIEGDPTQVYQVLMNLCTNAAHAMEEKGGRLEVSLKKADLAAEESAAAAGVEPGSYVRLRVRDTGHGMTPEILKRIFDPYFTTKEVGKGTGLGLSMVHGIVKSYGGGVGVSSEVGKGSTFDIYIPRVVEVPSGRKVDKAEHLLLGGHERVLFVDDEQTIVEIGEGILKHLGYEVVSRTSSVEALELFKKYPDRFDLVITDMTMPNMRGDQLAREILDIRPEIPIILCTGFSEAISEERAKALGVQEFVMKPLLINDLARTIRKAMESRKGRKKKKG